MPNYIPNITDPNGLEPDGEIELGDENETFERPPWLGEEVTANYRYLNSNLAVNPFSQW